MIDWIGSFISEATALTGKRPIIYRPRPGGGVHGPHWPVLARSAVGGGLRHPGAPCALPWTRWTFWQYTNSAWLPGVGLTDVDFFHPTAALPSLRDVTAKRAKQPRPRPGPRPHQRPAPHHATRPPKVTRRPQSAVARTSWIPPYATGR